MKKSGLLLALALAVIIVALFAACKPSEKIKEVSEEEKRLENYLNRREALREEKGEILEGYLQTLKEYRFGKPKEECKAKILTAKESMEENYKSLKELTPPPGYEETHEAFLAERKAHIEEMSTWVAFLEGKATLKERNLRMLDSLEAMIKALNSLLEEFERERLKRSK